MSTYFEYPNMIFLVLCPIVPDYYCTIKMIGLKVRFFEQRYLQKYNQIQPPDADGFCHGGFNS